MRRLKCPSARGPGWPAYTAPCSTGNTTAGAATALQSALSLGQKTPRLLMCAYRGLWLLRPLIAAGAEAFQAG